MTSKTLEFSETTSSKLWDLYTEDGEFKGAQGITLETCINKLVDGEKIIKTHSLKTQVDIAKFKDNVNRIYNILFNGPGSGRGKVCISKIINFAGVTFKHASIQKNKFYRPRFLVDVGKVEPNSKVLINTGYFVKIPSVCTIPSIVDNKIITSKTKERQSLIVVPKIENSGGDAIVPFLNAYDETDAGLFGVSFYTATGNVGKIQITLHALNASSINEGYIKIKNNNQNKKIYNPKGEIDFSKITHTNKPGSTSNIYNIVSDGDTFITIEPGIYNILLVDRKRSWNQNIFSTAGYLPGEGERNLVLPITVARNEASFNTHCLAKVGLKVSLFSESVSADDDSSFSLLNGFYFNDGSYKEKMKLIKSIKKFMSNLKVGFVMWKTSDANADPNNMLYYDYNNMLPKIPIDEMTEKMMFETATIPNGSMSRKLYRKLCFLNDLIEESKEIPEPDVKRPKLTL